MMRDKLHPQSIINILFLLGVSISAALLPVTAHARTIHVEFSYSATADGFRLYKNGVQVCEITDGTARQMDCDVTISHKDTYTLTAVTGATESASSPAYMIFRARALYKRMRGGSFAGGSM